MSVVVLVVIIVVGRLDLRYAPVGRSDLDFQPS
jgi:hypothetical protein